MSDHLIEVHALREDIIPWRGHYIIITIWVLETIHRGTLFMGITRIEAQEAAAFSL